MLFANFPVSSFSFISPRVSVILLKSLKLWVILRFDVGFFILFYLEGGGRNWRKGITLGRGGWEGVTLAPLSPGALQPQACTQGPAGHKKTFPPKFS